MCDILKADYINVSAEGEVVSEPKPIDGGYTFIFENRRGDYISSFVVIARDPKPIDFFKGDRIFIANAGFFVRNDKNCLAVTEASNISVIRKRCNMGTKSV